MSGSNDDIKGPLGDVRSRFRSRDRLASHGRRGSNIVSIDAGDDELLDALKSVGEEILKEPTPERLVDALRRKKR